MSNAFGKCHRRRRQLLQIGSIEEVPSTNPNHIINEPSVLVANSRTVLIGVDEKGMVVGWNTKKNRKKIHGIHFFIPAGWRIIYDMPPARRMEMWQRV